MRYLEKRIIYNRKITRVMLIKRCLNLLLQFFSTEPQCINFTLHLQRLFHIIHQTSKKGTWDSISLAFLL